VRNFEQAVEVPSMIGSLIWMRIDIPRSVYGNVVATARAGFLLSPLVENRQSFFALASTNWQHELADLEVA